MAEGEEFEFPTIDRALAAFPEPAVNDLLAESIEDLADDRDVVCDLAAVHLTLWIWRNSPFEDVQIGLTAPDGRGRYGGLNDAEMMRANIEATIVVRHAVSPEGVDWDHIERTLTDQSRLVAGAPLSTRSAQADVTGLYRHVREQVAEYRLVEAVVGWPRLMRFLAVGGLGSSWWLTPWWADNVAVWLEELEKVPGKFGTREHVRAVLVDDPLSASDELLGWALGKALGFARGRKRFLARRRKPEARFGGGMLFYQPVPTEWIYAANLEYRWKRPPRASRPASRQVIDKGWSTSVWVNHLDAAGMTRLLGTLELGGDVVFNGNPIRELRNQPAFLAEGEVAALGSGWALLSMSEIGDTHDTPAVAVFVLANISRFEAAQLIDTLDDLGSLPGDDVMLWLWAHGPDGQVTHHHDATKSDLMAALAVGWT